MISKLLVIPFFALLLSIALGPLLCHKFWEKFYPFIVLIFSSIVAGFYFLHHDTASVILSIVEFVQFILLIFALYAVTSGIFIDVNIRATTRNNILFLILGAVLANLIGTTGASMLLIRPFLQMNEKKLKPYHIIFFIFIVSNIGGALTPIGDPPLFIGFLKGVPFFWTLQHNLLPWALAIALLCCIFYFFDKKNQSKSVTQEDKSSVRVQGKKNIFFIIAIILAVFVNPIIFPNLPIIHFHGHEISFVREILFLIIAIVAFVSTDKSILHKNDFSWEPIKELAILFFGIFVTMTPVLTLLTQTMQNIDSNLISSSSLFWGTGLLSSFLDNAPTYLNFLTISMSCLKLNVANVSDVMAFANGEFLNSIAHLQAISVGAVFFGAMTYIGNGPNLMVKSIAEKKIKMPTFFEYMVGYSLKILLPILVVCWFIFFK